jgi:hypothetical protein
MPLLPVEVTVTAPPDEVVDPGVAGPGSAPKHVLTELDSIENSSQQPEPPAPAGPFAAGADAYWSTGWPVIPVIGKFPPKTGYTGWHGAYASYPDIQAWKDGKEGARNIAIRLRDGYLGLDVDNYGEKAGAATLARLESEYGPLPPTVMSTSRDDGISGIRLFKIPPGLSWPGEAGKGIEIIVHSHRYVMAWPSVHPDIGRPYGWIGPDGVELPGVPPASVIPDMPKAWVEGLSRGPAAPDTKADIDAASAASWIEATNAPSAAPCGPLAIERDKCLEALSSGGSRHDSARDDVLAVVRLADQGHMGVAVALDQIRTRFLALVADDRRGAAAEWVRMLTGAVAIVTASPSQRFRDPCVPPVPGAMGSLTPVIDTTGTAAQVLSLDPEANAGAPPAEVTNPPRPVARLDVITADTVVRRRVRYIWGQRIPLGAVTVMPGEEGIGKSTVGARIIADVTKGILPGEFFGCPRDVVVLAAEDGIEDVFVPRLAEAGADLARVHIIRGRIGPDDGIGDVIVPRDLDLLAEVVANTSAALVWIDSLVTTLPDDMKSIAYKDTAKVLRAIGGWAETHLVAVVAPWHLNKATGSDAAVRMMDSRAFRTAVRSVLLVVPDPEAEEGVTQGIVALDKANAGTLAVPAMRYRIRSASYKVEEVDPTGTARYITTSCGVADWIGTVEGDGRAIARAALTPAIERADGPREWLRGYLDGREVERKDVIAAGEKAGYSRASITRAASAIPVHSREVKGQDPATKRPFRRALWSPPRAGAQWTQESSHPSIAESTEPTGEGSDESIDPIFAGERQSAQSAQSSMGDQLELIGESTGDLAICRVCRRRRLLDDGQDICARTDEAHKAARNASDGATDPIA